MKAINATTIAKLIEAHIQGDEQKFLNYANFIADSFDEAGDAREARIIRSSFNEGRKNQSPVVLG